MSEKAKITVSQLLSDLKSGLDRKAIAEKYEVSQSEVAEWFQHPSLKNKRVRPAAKFELVDDTEEAPKKISAPKKVKEVSVAETPTATAETVVTETANTVVEQEEVAVTESPEPTGKISEVASADDATDEIESKKGLW